MGRTYIITILILLLTGISVYPQANDSSGTTVQKPLENLKLLPEQFNFIDNRHPESSSINESDQIDLHQLLNSYSVYPTMEFNLTDRIRSENKNKSVILWGGVVPFFSIPDPDKSEQESSFSKENFSIFWHLKKRF
ncbi:MAG TPA: hypothetical protein VGA95_13235 [Thermodesulfobacteriota bacterium]